MLEAEDLLAPQYDVAAVLPLVAAAFAHLPRGWDVLAVEIRASSGLDIALLAPVDDAHVRRALRVRLASGDGNDAAVSPTFADALGPFVTSLRESLPRKDYAAAA